MLFKKHSIIRVSIGYMCRFIKKKNIKNKYARTIPEI